MDEELKISFLTEAVSDAQEIIKFIEAKTGVVITILGAYFVVIFTDIDNIIKYYSYYSCLFFILLSLFTICLFASLIIVTRIIKPSNNPNDNIQLGEQANQICLVI
jgi:hypothetical protein